MRLSSHLKQRQGDSWSLLSNQPGPTREFQASESLCSNNNKPKEDSTQGTSVADFSSPHVHVHPHVNICAHPSTYIHIYADTYTYIFPKLANKHIHVKTNNKKQKQIERLGFKIYKCMVLRCKVFY